MTVTTGNGKTRVSPRVVLHVTVIMATTAVDAIRAADAITEMIAVGDLDGYAPPSDPDILGFLS